MGKYTPEQIRVAGFIDRLVKFLKGAKRDQLNNNVFFSDTRVVCGRRVGPSKKQRLRHAVVFGKF